MVFISLLTQSASPQHLLAATLTSSTFFVIAMATNFCLTGCVRISLSLGRIRVGCTFLSLFWSQLQLAPCSSSCFFWSRVMFIALVCGCDRAVFSARRFLHSLTPSLLGRSRVCTLLARWLCTVGLANNTVPRRSVRPSACR